MSSVLTFPQEPEGSRGAFPLAKYLTSFLRARCNDFLQHRISAWVCGSGFLSQPFLCSAGTPGTGQIHLYQFAAEDSQLSFPQLYEKMSNDLKNYCFMLNLIVSLARQREWDADRTNALAWLWRVGLSVSHLVIRLSEECDENILSILWWQLNKFWFFPKTKHALLKLDKIVKLPLFHHIVDIIK